MSGSLAPPATEREQLREAVHAFFGKTSSSGEVRRLMTEPAGFDHEHWRVMAEQLGLPALLVPEALGGFDAGFGELAVALEESGRALNASPLFATAVLATPAILRSGDGAAAARYLPAVAAGTLTATVATGMAAARWHPASVATRADVTERGTVRLWGTESPVLDGTVADLLIIAARGPAGIGLYLVERSAPGVTSTPLQTLDLTRRFARIELAGAPAQPLGAADGAAPTLGRVLDLAATATALEQAGGAQAALDMTVDHAHHRIQFGQPISAFQSVKHQCADLLVLVETARSLARHAAEVAVSQPEDLPLAASAAKAYCSDAYLHVAAAAIQLHGGIGFTWEHDAHLHLRRAKSSAALFGTPAQHRARVAELLEL